MKVKDGLIGFLYSGHINDRGSEKELWSLEAEDFDTAIQLLIQFNKKNAVKEYQYLKEEFINDELNGYYKDPDRFVRNLIETATKRMTAVEARRVRKKIENKFPADVRTQYSRVIMKLGQVFYDNLYHKHYAEYHKKLGLIYDEKASALKEWITKQEEKENLLVEMSAGDFEEILQVLQEIEEANGEKEIEETRWLRLD